MSSCLSDNAAEKDKVKQATECCRKILNHVNQAVKESEDKQVIDIYIFYISSSFYTFSESSLSPSQSHPKSPPFFFLLHSN